MAALIVLFMLLTIGDIINGFLMDYPIRRILLEYILKLPEMMGKMLPISALLASLFSLNKLKNHSELTAILAGGFSAKSVYKALLYCSLALGSLQLFNLGFLQPLANKIKRHEFEKSRMNESKYLARSRVGTDGLLWYKSQDYFTSFSAFDAQNNALRAVTIYFQNEQGLLNRVVKAKDAQFIGNSSLRLKNVTEFLYLDNQAFPEIRKKPLLEITINEAPVDFQQFESDITTLKLPELASFINRLQKTGIQTSEYEIMLYEKISLALICIAFALFPVSTVFTPNRRGASFGKNILATLMFSIVFWLIYSWMLSLGTSGKIPPIVATFTIPLVSLLFIFLIYRRNKSL